MQSEYLYTIQNSLYFTIKNNFIAKHLQIYKQTSEINKACFVISQRVKCIFEVYLKYQKQTSEINKACFVISQRVKCIIQEHFRY